MAFEIVIGQYHKANSIIHRLDARIKISLMLVLIVATFLANSIYGLLALLAFALAVAALSTIKVKIILQAMVPAFVLLLFPLLFNPLFIQSGETLVSWGILHITNDGLYQAGFMTLRLLLLFFFATLLTLCTSTIAISDAIATMLEPFARFGLPAYEFSMMVSIALRFIPTLMEDFSHIRKAQIARGAAIAIGGPIMRIKALIPLMVPMFAQSLRHAEELAQAMESRCYHGGTDRSHYRVFKIEAADIIATIICIALLVLMIVWL